MSSAGMESHFRGSKFELLLDDLKAAPNARLKASAVELFAHKRGLEKGAVVDHLLANHAGSLTRDAISMLLADGSPP